jgi:ubiquinone/menaquinone biosynthesis C-methylase UbiE
LSEAFREIGDLPKLRVLDIGCGIGLGHEVLSQKFGKLCGVDTSRESLKLAGQHNRKVDYKAYSGTKLPYKTDSFDAAYAICVLHHVPRMEWQNFVKEMLRVVRPGGMVAIIEHNPLHPGTQWIVRTIDLDKDAILLFPWKSRNLLKKGNAAELVTKYTLFTPFSGRFFRRLDQILSRIPLGAQYIVTARKVT